MNFIKDKELAKRFRKNAVPAKERLYYFLIFMVSMSAVGTTFGANLIQRPLNQWDIAMDIFALASTLLGTIFLYRTNTKGDKKEFIERYVCIGFPVIIQTTLLSVALYIIVLGIIEPGNLSDENPASTICDFLIMVVVAAYYYFRLNQSLKIASGAK